MGSMGANSARLTSQAQEKTLRKLLKQTANLKKEQYRIIDSEGNVVFQKQGKTDQVVMTVGEKRQYIDGNVTTHNHPAVDGIGGPMSSADITDFGYGAKAIVISAPEGEYRLTNLRFGKADQKATWVEMRDEVEKITQNQSFSKDLREANELMKKTDIGKRMQKISDEWARKREAGANKSELDAIANQYTALQNEYHEKRQKILRQIELRPYHEFYKKNAKKYGFEYIYPKGAF